MQTDRNMTEKYKYALAAREAVLELDSARSYFEQVTDPDLVEYASFRMETAKLRYECLLRRAKGTEPTLLKKIDMKKLFK